MGIRFFCPNGHKLHVKAFQAGRRGICPHCGVSVEIPLESTRVSSRRLAAKRAKSAAGNGPGRPSTPLASATGHPEFGAEVHPADARLEVGGPAELQESPGQAGAFLASPATGPSPGQARQGPPADDRPATDDPLAEAPNAVWYVRPPSGGQYGPASPDLMRTWIAENRVSPDCLVWREGWRDWREAGAVFPHLGGNDFVPGIQNIVLEDPLDYHPVTVRQRDSGLGRSHAGLGLILAVAVGVALLGLAAILLWVQRA